MARKIRPFSFVSNIILLSVMVNTPILMFSAVILACIYAYEDTKKTQEITTVVSIAILVAAIIVHGGAV